MIKYGLTICLLAGAQQAHAMHLLKPRLMKNVNAVMPKLLAMSSTSHASMRAYSVKNDDTNKEQELPFSSNPAHIYVAGYYSRMFGDDPPSPCSPATIGVCTARAPMALCGQSGGFLRPCWPWWVGWPAGEAAPPRSPRPGAARGGSCQHQPVVCQPARRDGEPE